MALIKRRIRIDVLERAKSEAEAASTKQQTGMVKE